jgi:hypothetical protein
MAHLCIKLGFTYHIIAYDDWKEALRVQNKKILDTDKTIA